MASISGTSPNANYEEFKVALREAIAALEDGFEERFGYPTDAGSNHVADAGKEDLGSPEVYLPEELRAFYASVGEIELPDVHIGYFVHPISTIAESAERVLPTRVESGSIQLDVVTFGSDGGGGLFSIGSSGGAIYYLPSGSVDRGVYRGGLGDARVISPDLQTFLGRLLSMVRMYAETGACQDF